MLRNLTVLTLSLACGLPVPALAEVVASGETAFVARGEVIAAAGPDLVWADLIAPAKWWDPAHTWSKDAANLYLDAQATGCFCEQLPPAAGAEPGAPRGSVEHMHVIHVVPGKLLRLTGGLGPLQAEPVAAVLTITLDPAGEGTRIAYDYRVSGLATIKGTEIAGPVDGVLSGQMGRLAAWTARVGPAASPAP